jgi:hypothetical protein
MGILVATWHELPEVIRAGIMAMVKAARRQSTTRLSGTRRVVS